MFHHDDSLKFPILRQCNLNTGRVYLVTEGERKGEVYPSITRILSARPKPELNAWKARVGEKEASRISRAASSKGTSIHKLVEYYLNNDPLPLDIAPHVQELWHYLSPWLAQNITTVYAQEQDVFSHRLQVAGRMDLLAQCNERNAIVDVKTASREKREEWIEDYFLQCTFYAMATYELTGQKFNYIVLPIVSPGGVQLFESTPAKHMKTLVARINEYYQTYAEKIA